MSDEVVIVGGGVIGLSTAYYALLRGHRVTILERHGPVRDGCSFGNAGLIVPSHFVPLATPGMVRLGLKWMADPESPFYVKPRCSWELLGWGLRFWRAATAAQVSRAAPLLRDLSLASRGCYEELQGALPDAFDLVHNGLLVLCQTHHGLDEESRVAARARSLGIDAQVLSREQTAQRQPGLTMDVAGSVHFPQDCSLSPQRFMEALQKRLHAAGAAFVWNSRVNTWRREGSRIVAARTDQGDVAGDHFVLSFAREPGPRCSPAALVCGCLYKQAKATA